MVCDNMIEVWRKAVLDEVFSTSTLREAWPVWRSKILDKLPELNGRAVFQLGDYFSEIFKSTSPERADVSLQTTQSMKSSAGNLLESLVTIYCNLCLVGRNAIVIKKRDGVMPRSVMDALTVSYRSAQFNSEFDVVGLVLPEGEFEKEMAYEHYLEAYYDSAKGKLFLKREIDRRVADCFSSVKINVIQCKTNWNDNAQIPMLWDMIYSSAGKGGPVQIGVNDRTIREDNFTYSFVTIPTVNPEKIKADSVAVQRVVNLSGGNYWGLPSKRGVANNIKEMLSRNFYSAGAPSIEESFNRFVSKEGGEEYVRKVFRL